MKRKKSELSARILKRHIGDWGGGFSSMEYESGHLIWICHDIRFAKMERV